MTATARRAELRNFGLIVGGIFGVIGVWPLIFRGQGVRPWAVALAVALIVPALVAPSLLGPAQRAWMAVGNVLGWINTRLILGIVFFGMMTPMALVFRLIGKDPMRRTFDPKASSYRVPCRPRPGAHMLHQF